MSPGGATMRENEKTKSVIKTGEQESRREEKGKIAI